MGSDVFCVSAAYLAHLPVDLDKIHNVHKINVPTAAVGHLRLRRILLYGRTRYRPAVARVLANTQDEESGKAAR
jgi:hypothetical protein